jgi:diguanylate cyclase (GGDEF)-like protein
MAKATGRVSGKARRRRPRPTAVRTPSTRLTASKSSPVKRPATGASDRSARMTAAAKTIASLTRRLAQARRHIAALEARADTDYLLDILNRRGFERELRRSIAYVTRYRASAALLVVDVDRLKPINDAYGHAAGDHLLKTVVVALSSHIRQSDMLGRLGGDEFGVLLWNLDARNAHAKAAALERAIDGTACEYRGRPLSAGVSIGVTVLGAGDEANEILERADRAMYARKQTRRSKKKSAVRR